MTHRQTNCSSILNKETDILLINPPFSSATNPYIAIPTLSAYLKAKGIRVEAYDLNREFFYRLLSPQEIKKGFDHCIERFNELNGKAELNFSQAIEMKNMVFILSKYPFYKEEIEKLSRGRANFDDVRRSMSRHLFTIAATMPYFPEFIVTKPSTYIMSKTYPCSSKDIFKSLDKSDYYTDAIRKIIHEELKGRLPKCVGISIPFSSQIIPAFQCAKIIKDISPETHITMGGPCISIFFRETKNNAFFDIADSFIMDEGEIPLECLIRELSNEKPMLAHVPGLVYREEDKMHRNPTVPPVNLEKSFPPDYSIFQLDKYLNPVEHMTFSLRLSRGCYWKKCTFCRTHLPMTSDFQQPRGEVIYKNIRHIIEHTGVRKFFFSDEASQPEALEYISRNLLKDNIKITWRAHAKVSKKLTSGLCHLFKDAGCIQLNLGIESFSGRILNGMKKGITTGRIDEVLKEINGVIPVGAYMIVGYPGETENESLEGYKKICSYHSAGLLTYYYYSIFVIAYGSEIWENPGNFGISDIHIPADQDLLPDVYNFKCSGMSREKAYELYNRFSGTENLIKESFKFKELYIGDKVIPLRYDLTNILGIECRSSEGLYMPFARWINKMNEEFIPLRPNPE